MTLVALGQAMARKGDLTMNYLRLCHLETGRPKPKPGPPPKKKQKQSTGLSVSKAAIVINGGWCTSANLLAAYPHPAPLPMPVDTFTQVRCDVALAPIAPSTAP
jgi:hypothetical protein